MSDYDKELARLQLALVEMQHAAMGSGDRIVLVLEGRDGAGKDGSIKRITEHLSVRSTRVLALPKPSDRERTQWYFQRYVAHLPSAGEFVIFNRSWYNRAGVEVVMGFSTASEQAEFLRDTPEFERMLVESGIKLIKIWLDISRKEQGKRLDDRRRDPLKALKVSDMDAVAQEKWDAYSDARNAMLTRTHTPLAPWYCVRADEKKPARLAIIQHILQQAAPPEIANGIERPDPSVLFPFDMEAIRDGRLAE
ncbi:polyphosphate kinase 2, PA0141 family [Faunimonas pinastri]|uniref:ADP/GDP-polyphosphate phosphotransferase n=1 Tax=Faunimonas pinastri TaxID=1855383 RepID=A0A1H9HRP4_9HYPH|nr:polyphosphate kinase 2 [Faunimonas pinastri]SEQ65040.1 polyphosphate kinase 2, PA0141 family [Faunimonas pinastri]